METCSVQHGKHKMVQVAFLTWLSLSDTSREVCQTGDCLLRRPKWFCLLVVQVENFIFPGGIKNLDTAWCVRYNGFIKWGEGRFFPPFNDHKGDKNEQDDRVWQVPDFPDQPVSDSVRVKLLWNFQDEGARCPIPVQYNWKSRPWWWRVGRRS